MTRYGNITIVCTVHYRMELFFEPGVLTGSDIYFNIKHLKLVHLTLYLVVSSMLGNLLKFQGEDKQKLKRRHFNPSLQWIIMDYRLLCCRVHGWELARRVFERFDCFL